MLILPEETAPNRFVTALGFVQVVRGGEVGGYRFTVNWGDGSGTRLAPGGGGARLPQDRPEGGHAVGVARGK